MIIGNFYIPPDSDLWLFIMDLYGKVRWYNDDIIPPKRFFAGDQVFEAELENGEKIFIHLVFNNGYKFKVSHSDNTKLFFYNLSGKFKFRLD